MGQDPALRGSNYVLQQLAAAYSKQQNYEPLPPPPGWALFQPDSAVVPEAFAREHGLALGSPLALNVGGVSKTMTVRGILEAKGPATAFNGAIVVACGQPIVARESAAFLADGTIAGSVLTMDRAFRMLVREMGLSMVEAATVCATTPAE